MARLIKRHAEEQHEYKFQHNWTIWTEMSCDETGEWSSSEDTPNVLSDRQLWELISNATADFNDESSMLTEIAQEQVSEAITGLKLKLNKNGKALWTVTTNAELDDATIEKLGDWIEGQCGDGYGEGLEQTPMLEERDYEDVYLEDEDDEEDDGPAELTRVDVDYSYAVKLYPGNDTFNLQCVEG